MLGTSFMAYKITHSKEDNINRPKVMYLNTQTKVFERAALVIEW